MGRKRSKRDLDNEQESAEDQEDVSNAQEDRPPKRKTRAAVGTAGSQTVKADQSSETTTRKKRRTKAQEPEDVPEPDATPPVPPPPVIVNEGQLERALRHAAAHIESKKRRMAASPGPASSAVRSLTAVDILLGRKTPRASSTPQPLSSNPAVASPVASTSRSIRTVRKPSLKGSHSSQSPSIQTRSSGRPIRSVRTQQPSRKGKERAVTPDSSSEVDEDSGEESQDQVARQKKSVGGTTKATRMQSRHALPVNGARTLPVKDKVTFSGVSNHQVSARTRGVERPAGQQQAEPSDSRGDGQASSAPQVTTSTRSNATERLSRDSKKRKKIDSDSESAPGQGGHQHEEASGVHETAASVPLKVKGHKRKRVVSPAASDTAEALVTLDNDLDAQATNAKTAPADDARAADPLPSVSDEKAARKARKQEKRRAKEARRLAKLARQGAEKKAETEAAAAAQRAAETNATASTYQIEQEKSDRKAAKRAKRAKRAAKKMGQETSGPASDDLSTTQAAVGISQSAPSEFAQGVTSIASAPQPAAAPAVSKAAASSSKPTAVLSKRTGGTGAKEDEMVAKKSVNKKGKTPQKIAVEAAQPQMPLSKRQQKRMRRKQLEDAQAQDGTGAAAAKVSETLAEPRAPVIEAESNAVREVSISLQPPAAQADKKEGATEPLAKDSLLTENVEETNISTDAAVILEGVTAEATAGDTGTTKEARRHARAAKRAAKEAKREAKRRRKLDIANTEARVPADAAVLPAQQVAGLQPEIGSEHGPSPGPAAIVLAEDSNNTSVSRFVAGAQAPQPTETAHANPAILLGETIEETDSIDDFTDEHEAHALPTRNRLADEESDCDPEGFAMHQYTASDSSDWEEDKYETALRPVPTPTIARPSTSRTASSRRSSRPTAPAKIAPADLVSSQPPSARGLRKRVAGRALTAASQQPHLASDSEVAPAENEVDEFSAGPSPSSGIRELSEAEEEPETEEQSTTQQDRQISPESDPAVLPLTSPSAARPPSEQSPLVPTAGRPTLSDAEMSDSQTVGEGLDLAPSVPAPQKVGTSSGRPSLLRRKPTFHAVLDGVDAAEASEDDSDGALTTDGNLSEEERPSRSVARGRARQASTSASDSASEKEQIPARPRAAGADGHGDGASDFDETMKGERIIPSLGASLNHLASDAPPDAGSDDDSASSRTSKKVSSSPRPNASLARFGRQSRRRYATSSGSESDTQDEPAKRLSAPPTIGVAASVKRERSTLASFGAQAALDSSSDEDELASPNTGVPTASPVLSSLRAIDQSSALSVAESEPAAETEPTSAPSQAIRSDLDSSQHAPNESAAESDGETRLQGPAEATPGMDAVTSSVSEPTDVLPPSSASTEEAARVVEPSTGHEGIASPSALVLERSASVENSLEDGPLPDPSPVIAETIRTSEHGLEDSLPKANGPIQEAVLPVNEVHTPTQPENTAVQERKINGGITPLDDSNVAVGEQIEHSQTNGTEPAAVPPPSHQQQESSTPSDSESRPRTATERTSQSAKRIIPTLSQISSMDSPEKERFSSVELSMTDIQEASSAMPHQSETGPQADSITDAYAAESEIADNTAHDVAEAGIELGGVTASPAAGSLAMAIQASHESMYSSSSSVMSQELLDMIRQCVENTSPRKPGHTVKDESVPQEALSPLVDSDSHVMEAGSTQGDVPIVNSLDSAEETQALVPTADTVQAEHSVTPSDPATTHTSHPTAAEAMIAEQEAHQARSTPDVAAFPAEQPTGETHVVASSGDAVPDEEARGTVEPATIADSDAEAPVVATEQSSVVVAPTAGADTDHTENGQLYPNLNGLKALVDGSSQVTTDAALDGNGSANGLEESPEAQTSSSAQQEQRSEPAEASEMRQPRFADIDPSPPPLPTGFDTARQLDTLASQSFPEPASLQSAQNTRRESAGSDSPDESQTLSLQLHQNSQVSQLRDEASQSALPSPMGSGNVSEVEVERSLVKNRSKVPLFAPETPTTVTQSQLVEDDVVPDSSSEADSDSQDRAEELEDVAPLRRVSTSSVGSPQRGTYILQESPEPEDQPQDEHAHAAEASQRARGQHNHPASHLRSSTSDGGVDNASPRRTSLPLTAPRPPNTQVMFRTNVTSMPTRPHANNEIPSFHVQPVTAYKKSPPESAARLPSSRSTPTLAQNGSTSSLRSSGFQAKSLKELASAPRPSRLASRFSGLTASTILPSSAGKPVQKSEESDADESSSSSDSEQEDAASSQSQIPVTQRAGAGKRTLSAKTKRGSLGAFGSQK